MIIQSDIIPVMSDDELFIKSMMKIKEQMTEERECIKRTDELNSQIAAEYDAAIKYMEKAVSEIHEIFDLYSVDEELFVFILDCFEEYCDNFIIDGRDEKIKKQNEEEFSQLQDILFEFYDDGEDDEIEEES